MISDIRQTEKNFRLFGVYENLKILLRSDPSSRLIRVVIGILSI